ncbi:ferrous iron transport protein B [Spirochaeta thermophila]|uniref:Ferrous iron transport protein B n=1 Tax=Winmispira thermophila (strain ATCC 49972 / DSM 6192 / RI 19.B1) TaxID=665571 RepID=E0RR09_WINT6|nr:ferrous iron transport protein B [Spirochaeta thermophila]ADN01587.1 ferrous iron transport protein B [Spirochaeta thermophila DSM 6192]
MRTYTCALIGTPNTGKTSIFNAITSRTEYIGNWPGVTIERTDGILTTVYQGEDVRLRIVDLPGIYHLGSSAPEERVAFDFFLKEKVDLVINVMDGLSLQKNLYLTLQLLEEGLPVHVVITKKDLLEQNGIRISPEALSRRLGVPVSLVNSHSRQDARLLVNSLVQSCLSPPSPPHPVTYDEVVEEWLSRWQHELSFLGVPAPRLRTLLLLFLEGEEVIFSLHPSLRERKAELAASRTQLEARMGEDLDVYLARRRYEEIESILKEAHEAAEKLTLTERIDRVVLHKVWGIPIFWAVLFLLFWATTSLGGVFIDFFDGIFQILAVDLPLYGLSRIGAGPFVQTLVEGVGTGIQTVATFVPIIYILFFLLTILEDCGYMARAAFVADRGMRGLGLSGKAFVPLLLGFGCTVSSILATRTLESRKERLLTIFMAPLMSCGARLPVYVIFAAAFFPRSAGLVVFSLYFVGIVLAVGTGLLFKHTLFKAERTPLVMELPPYHLPNMSLVLKITWIRFSAYIKRAGITITTAVFILSLLNAVVIENGKVSFESGSPDSLLIRTGKAITPVFEPMGVEEENWPAVAGLFTGLFAKETIIGTLQAMYGIEAEEEAEEPFSLQVALSGLVDAGRALLRGLYELLVPSPGGEEEEGGFSLVRERFTPAAAYAYLLFVLIYSPCVAALSAILQQAGVGTMLANAGYLTLLAWIVGTFYFQVVEGGSLLWLGVAGGLLLGLMVVLYLVGRSTRPKEAVS